MKRLTTCVCLLFLGAGLALAHTPQDEERFSAAGLANHEVERFYKEFREAVSASDKKKVASLVSFPITVTLATGKRRTIRTKADFIKSYDLIFDDTFRELIAKTEFADLWAKSSGVATPREKYGSPVSVNLKPKLTNPMSSKSSPSTTRFVREWPL